MTSFGLYEQIHFTIEAGIALETIETARLNGDPNPACTTKQKDSFRSIYGRNHGRRLRNHGRVKGCAYMDQVHKHSGTHLHTK